MRPDFMIEERRARSFYEARAKEGHGDIPRRIKLLETWRESSIDFSNIPSQLNEDIE